MAGSKNSDRRKPQQSRQQRLTTAAPRRGSGQQQQPTRRPIVRQQPSREGGNTRPEPSREGGNTRPEPNRGGSNARHEQAHAPANDSKEFLEQLQAWANATVARDISDLEAEFQRLQRMPKPEPSPEFHRNPQLNRYRDVLCVEKGRVQLTSGRYIHANWIESNGERRFICTQGPMPQTVDDFWALVLQEGIQAIVMLCDTVELGRIKCHQYWPMEPNSTMQTNDGNIHITNVTQEQLEGEKGNLFKTRLQVTSANPKQEQIVRHFHWRKWPDRGVPVNHLAALRLLHYIGTYKKILVHCSAGIGRTGTIVAIYLAQNQLRSGQNLDLFELIRELRQQRAGSVQSLDQYLYIYSVLLRYANNKADRHHIAMDSAQAERLIQQIAARIYRG